MFQQPVGLPPVLCHVPVLLPPDVKTKLSPEAVKLYVFTSVANYYAAAAVSVQVITSESPAPLGIAVNEAYIHIFIVS